MAALSLDTYATKQSPLASLKIDNNLIVNMKHAQYVLIACLSLLLGMGASAQENTSWKRLEHNIQLGGGLFLESGLYANEQNPGIVLRVSYGLDIRFNEHWSVMPGASLRAQLGDVRHFMGKGNDPDGMALADVFMTARYHFDIDGSQIVVGLGPALSYMVSPDTYYIDADPTDPLNNKEKFNRFDVGIQPSVCFLHGKHFQWGFEANIGLLNAMRQYPEYNRTGSIHLHYVAITCGWHF